MSGVKIGEDGELYIIAKCKGSMEGKEWSDGAGGQVKQICIWHGDLIYGIQVSYERNGEFCLSPRHGGTEGDFEQILLDEPITCVSGYYGSWCWDTEIFVSEEEAPYFYTTVIRSLKFETGRVTYGPFGHETGTPFRFKMSTGCAGFHGWSFSDDAYGFLKAIGVYVGSFASKPNSDCCSLSISSPPSMVDPNENDEQ